MQSGYLIVETHTDHPGMIRIRETDTPPAAPDLAEERAPRLRYAARFNDLSAAHMHAHAELRRWLVDLETGLYRTDPLTAVSVVESIGLGHRQIYVDPDLAQDRSLSNAVSQRRWRHGFADRIWQIVGVAAAIFLFMKLIFGF